MRRLLAGLALAALVAGCDSITAPSDPAGTALNACSDHSTAPCAPHFTPRRPANPPR
jgi:hypothetical protein